MKRVLVFWLALASCAYAQISPGMSEADLLKAKGASSGKATLGAKVLYRWPDLQVVVEQGVVARVTIPTAPTSPSVAPAVAAPPATPPSAAARSGANFQTPWQDESQYVIEQIASDLAEMAYYLKFHSALPNNLLPATAVDVTGPQPINPGNPRANQTFTYRVTVDLGASGQVSCVVPVGNGIWLPGCRPAQSRGDGQDSLS